MKVEFQDLVVERGPFRVTWEWIGEGRSGDYDEKDPADVPMLRFSVFHKVTCSGGTAEMWEEMEDGSYCTRMSVGTSEKVLCEAASIVLAAARTESPKRKLESLGWMRSEDFDRRHR
jgi:hypothetical protein